MKNILKSRTIILAVVLVVVVIVAAVIVRGTWQQKNIAPGPIIATSPTQIPSNFPDGIPFFYQKTVLQNYSVSSNGQIQSTHQFVSTNAAFFVYKMYQDFFREAGWSVTLEQHPQILSQGIFYASKGDMSATVIVDSVLTTASSSGPHQTIVTLNFFTKDPGENKK